MTGWVFLVALASLFSSFFCVWAYDVSVRYLFFEVRVNTEERNEMMSQRFLGRKVNTTWPRLHTG